MPDDQRGGDRGDGIEGRRVVMTGGASSIGLAISRWFCALGAPVTVEDTPRLYQMLRRVETDAGAATGAAKDKYNRARPFMLDGQPTCAPASRSSWAMPGGRRQPTAFARTTTSSWWTASTATIHGWPRA